MFELLVEREGEKIQLIVGDGNPVALQLKLKPLGTMTVSCALLAVSIEGNSGGKIYEKEKVHQFPSNLLYLSKGRYHLCCLIKG